MIRSAVGDLSYWNSRVEFDLGVVADNSVLISSPSQNPVYEPQFVFNLAERYLRLTLRRYSRGDPICELSQYFPKVLDNWGLSNKLAGEVCHEHKIATCRDWDFRLSNLNHYNWCFWLVGLALALGVPDVQWRRLLKLIDGEGEDILLDRIITSRQPERKIGTVLLHAKPYARLLKAIDAPRERQAGLLRDFVDHWYPELKRPAPKSRKTPTVEPYWYIYGDPEKHPLEKGSYFGHWCIEAVAAVKAFGIDDSLCIGHEYYPGDLLRPDGPSTHPARDEPRRSWWSRLLSK